MRSGYRLLLWGFPRTDNDLYGDIESEMRMLYRQLWLAKVPKKLKITTWRILHNYVPTRSNLLVRRLADAAACFRCGMATKTTLHVCQDCPLATDGY